MSASISLSSNAAIIPIHDKTSLCYLLETAAQKTYHELYTMAELLQNKNSLERKKELVKFACRTRQLFIRLLAVVKWAATAGKVNTCERIQDVLERHALLLRETSDSLAHLAREKLVNARLSNYPLTDAVDALTLGSVNYLPERISESTAPLLPVTESERRQILPRLQQILTARLSIAELPIQFSSVIIKNGLVILAVDGEFEVKLSVTSDNLFAPWHVHKTRLFLRDPEEPEQELLHATQMQTLTNYIQSLLVESENPFVELYRYLHYYCQSLRLQILFEQACRIRNRSTKQKHLHLSSYIPCKLLCIEYWKECPGINPNNPHKKAAHQDKHRDIGMNIICDDDGKLHIIHWPPLSVEDSVAILQILEKPSFTMEEILNRTIHARCQRRFEELKETILSITTVKMEIDSTIPALKCELLPEHTSEETLFISISPLPGLYKVYSYMETRFCQQLEHALNRDHGTLIDAINNFKTWLIQQRIPSLLSHKNCRVYTRLPALNLKNELMVPFVHNSVFIELMHNEGYYILVHISDPNQLLLQYYLLIVEKRSSTHDPLILQQQQNLSYNSTTTSSDEYAKWILEPLVICALDPTAFLRRELIELKTIFELSKDKLTIVDERGMKRARPASVQSLKLLLKLINYYDEMLSFTFLKEEFQRKKTICKGIIYSPWTGIPQLDIVRTWAGDDSFTSNTELFSYINECFWPRLLSSTIRLVYTLRDTQNAYKYIERHWIFQLQMPDKDYFHNCLVKTPYNSIVSCNQISAKLYPKLVDHIHHELRTAFELTHLFESYSLTLTDSIDLRAISEVTLFNFFKATIHYGPNFNFIITLIPRTHSNTTDLFAHQNSLFDLRFTSSNSKFLTTAHQILNGKLMQFLHRARSVKQFIRLLHMTAIPIACIARMNCFNRPAAVGVQGGFTQPLLSFVPYTESRWRLIFGQIFALDIQICGPNLILIRDGAYSVQLNHSLPDLMPIPRIKEFLSKYADERGLSFEFTHITDRFRDREFLLPELQLPPSNASIQNNTSTSLNRTLTSGNATTPQLLHPVGTPNPSFNSLTPGSVGPASHSQQQANSPSQPAISPGSNIMGSSPLMTITGSPMASTAPASQMTTGPASVGVTSASPGNPFDTAYCSPGFRPVGSTFPSSLLGPSPGTPGNLPTSSVPTPSNIRSEENTTSSSTIHSYNRYLPSKSSYPVYMSQQTFFRMLHTSDGRQWSKLEIFLLSSLLVKQFSRLINEGAEASNSTIRLVPNELDTYRIEHLSLQISFPFDIQTSTYRMQFISLGDASSQQPSNVIWLVDELQILDNYFNSTFFPSSLLTETSNINPVPSLEFLSLGATPGRTTVMGMIQKMFSNINSRVLRDLIKVIRLEKNPDNNHMWRVRWCLAFPNGNGMQHVGAPAIFFMSTTTFLFSFQLIPRMHRNDFQMMGGSILPPSPLFLILQHDMSNNQTTFVDRMGKLVNTDARYQNMMKILNGSRENIKKYECSLYPSIYELVSCLQI